MKALVDMISFFLMIGCLLIVIIPSPQNQIIKDVVGISSITLLVLGLCDL